MFNAIIALLTIVKAVVDMLNRRQMLDDARKQIIAEQLLDIQERVKRYDEIDKRIDNASDADLDRLRNKYTRQND